MDKNLKSLIEENYRLVWGKNDKMVKYCLSRVSNAVILSNGLIYIFEKPHLETSFCFGYDNDEASYNHANDMVETVTSDYGEYFVKRNIDSFKNLEKTLTDKFNRFLFHTKYNKSNFASTIYKKSDIEFHSWITPRNVEMFELNDEDVTKLIEVNKLEMEKMSKRCFTYLKKYGTEKLRVWSYWRD